MHRQVLDLARALESASVPYAIGGAIVIAYCTEPRSTTDIDINVFLSAEQVARALDALQHAGIPFDYDRLESRIRRDAQVRFDWDGTMVDLFFSNVPFHASSAARTRRVPFGEGEISILSCADLVVYKAMFNRSRDWVDIESILHAQGANFDLDYARGWLVAMVGDHDGRVIELDKIASEVASAEGESPTSDS